MSASKLEGLTVQDVHERETVTGIRLQPQESQPDGGGHPDESTGSTLRNCSSRSLLDELVGRCINPEFHRSGMSFRRLARVSNGGIYRELVSRLVRLEEIQAAFASGQVMLPAGPEEAAVCSRDVLADEIRREAAL